MADSNEDANYLVTSLYHMAIGTLYRSTKPKRPTVPDMNKIWSGPERYVIQRMVHYTFAVSPKTVEAKLQQLLQ